MTQEPASFVLGWEEWVGLPDLGLPAIKAKVDTGARTSALHAFLIEPYGPPEAPMVRFGIHPIPGRHDIEIYCSAPIVDRREVTSSNGEREWRYVIRSNIEIGDRNWPIEITLTNREAMTYRMLLGRQAIREDAFVDPSSSFRQPKLSYKLYRHLPARDLVRRSLRIAVLTRTPERPSNRRLKAAAHARGHVLEVIDAGTLTFVFDQGSRLEHGGEPLAHYDAVISRLSPRDGALSTAAVRHLEMMGSTALNAADAIDRLREPILAMQVLSHHAVPIASPAAEGADSAEGGWGRRRLRPVIRLLVIGGAISGVAELRRGKMRDAGTRRLKVDRALALKAVRVLGLGFAAVDITREGDRRTGARAVARVTAAPDIGAMERATGERIAEAVIAEVEGRVRSWVRRSEPGRPPRIRRAAATTEDDE